MGSRQKMAKPDRGASRSKALVAIWRAEAGEARSINSRSGPPLHRATPRSRVSPLAGVGHRRPRLLLGARLTLLQQLDRDVVGRADECHAPVARRSIDGDAGLHQPVADRVNVVHLIGQVAKIPALAVFLRIPVEGEL